MKKTWPIVVVLALLQALACEPIVVQGGEIDPQLAAIERLYRSGGPSAALPEFERLLGEYSDQDAKANRALTLGYIGECHWRLGNFDESRNYLDRALALKQELGDRYQAAKTMNVLGLLEWDLGNFDQAIRQFEEANSIGRELGDRKLEGATLNNLSMVYDELGDYSRSLEQYEQVLEIYSGIDFPRGKGDTLGNIGGVHLLLGHYAKSVGYYHQALEISEQLGSLPAMSQDHGNLGLAYTGLGRIDTALAHFDTALEYARQAGMTQEEGFWLRGLANAQIRAGRHDLGIENHKAALKIYAEIEAKALLLDALHDMGRLQLTLGDLPSARSYVENAIAVAREIESSRGITINLIALGDLDTRFGQSEKARSLYMQALVRARETGETALESEALLRLAQADLDAGRLDTAGEMVETALEISGENDALVQEISAIYLGAELARKHGEYDDALEGYEDATTRAKGLPDPDMLWQIEFGRALAHEADGNKAAAISALQLSIEHIESIRNLLREKRFRTGYLQDKQKVYLMLARLQAETGQNSAAFGTAERLRNWKYWSQTDSGSPFEALSHEQKQNETALRERIRQLQRLLHEEVNRDQPGRRQLAVETFSRELVAVEREYQSLMDDLQGPQAGEVAMRMEPDPEALRATLLPAEALLEYLVGPDNVIIFVLSREEFRTIKVPARRADLRSRIELLRDLVRQSDGNRWKKPAASLYALLLSPLVAEGMLDGIEKLYIVPHDVLNYLPFALLTEGSGTEQPLIEHHVLAVLPSASVLAMRQDNRGIRSLLAAAPERSRLQYAPEEAKAIVALFEPNSRLIAGSAATETAFKGVAKNYEVLHLATHGRFNRFNPLLSSLELEPDSANDGSLEVHEILNLELDSDMVTLSACDTGMGSGYLADLPAGDEFVSLTRAFLQAGSNSVLATLWEVDDRSTVELMKDFYRRLEEPGAINDKAVALANAQRALRSSSMYEHPFFWAPYVLVDSVNPNGRDHGFEVTP